MHLIDSRVQKVRTITIHATRECAEHAAHAGKLNGRLRVTHDQFRKRGCTGELIADAIEELEYKGLVKVQRGRAADGTPHPNYYQLTFVGDHEGSPPTNEWKKVSAERCVQWGETERAARAQKRKRKAERQRKSSLREPELARSVNTEPAPPASKAA